MSLAVAIRPATINDIPEILRQRRGMYEDMDYEDSPALERMVAACEPYLRQAIAEGSLRGWLAMLAGRVGGGGAVVISPWPSHPYDLECRRATILNVYVYPEFRRRGIARLLMQNMIEWCRKDRFVFVALHASRDGRALYESLGFKPSNEMTLELGS
jgi:GNAT superfamily N-acetyltransferase